jgi:hypothetical protein
LIRLTRAALARDFDAVFHIDIDVARIDGSLLLCVLFKAGYPDNLMKNPKYALEIPVLGTFRPIEPPPRLNIVVADSSILVFSEFAATAPPAKFTFRRVDPGRENPVLFSF